MNKKWNEHIVEVAAKLGLNFIKVHAVKIEAENKTRISGQVATTSAHPADAIIYVNSDDFLKAEKVVLETVE